MTDAKDFHAFVRNEDVRRASLADLCTVLRTYHLSEEVPTWPDTALPVLADIAFADGAAFLTPEDAGDLRILQRPAQAQGDYVELGITGRFSTLWKLHRRPEDSWVMDSHMPAERLDRMGVSLPAQSSFLAMRLDCLCRPSALLAVWRIPEGGRAYSRDSFEHWDVAPLMVAGRLVSLTLDGRQLLAERIRLASIRLWAKALVSVLKPKLAHLHVWSVHLPSDQARELNSGLQLLDDSLRSIEDRLVMGLTSGPRPKDSDLRP